MANNDQDRNSVNTLRDAETFQGRVEPEGIVAGYWNLGRIIFGNIRFYVVLLLNLWWVSFRRRSWSKPAPLFNIV